MTKKQKEEAVTEWLMELKDECTMNFIQEFEKEEINMGKVKEWCECIVVFGRELNKRQSN
jgi:ferritin